MVKAAGPALRAEGLTKRYGDLAAVDGLELEVPRGVIFGFLGPNGAGKSTTINMLVGLTPPTSGGATVAGSGDGALLEVKCRIGVAPEKLGRTSGSRRWSRSSWSVGSTGRARRS